MENSRTLTEARKDRERAARAGWDTRTWDTPDPAPARLTTRQVGRQVAWYVNGMLVCYQYGRGHFEMAALIADAYDMPIF